jgi:hypothetical protein
LYKVYDIAVTASDGTTTGLLAGRLTEVNNAIAKLTGELASSPLVVNNTQNIFTSDPGFAQFQQQLIGVLRHFPDARNAVVAEFERLERTLAAPPSPGVTYDHQTAA